ncbi:MAG: MlaD family protein, partial [Bacteroidales bacterium]|nr:MlaD family protein [Bacteroidales bacterium]
MKLLKSTEIKIALFALAGLFLLVWGINFLKGIDVFKKHCTYYVIFEKTAGLLPAHLVTINGMNVGIVDEIELTSDVPNKVLVRIDVNKSISIPINSVIRIATPNPLSSPQVEILMGNEKQYIQHGDTIQGAILTGALDNLGGIVSNLDTSIVILKTVLQGSILTELE